MARIRSVHPGFFTDEDLVSVSAFARLLFIGLGVEADDKGVFEWKPLTLKMRVFPADNVEIAELLEELAGANCIAMYEIDGRKYGAIRNFRKHQRPKTPNDVHPISDDFRKYVALPDTISDTPPANPKPFPPKGEKPPQMEDGGCKGKEKSSGFSEDKKPVRTSPKKYSDEFEAFWKTWKSIEGGGDKAPAFDAWKKLSPDDRSVAASVAAEWFKAWRKAAPDATAIHASTFLNKRRFDGFEPPSTGKVISQNGMTTINNKDPLWPALVSIKRQKTGKGVNAESWAFNDEWIAEARSKAQPEHLNRTRQVQSLMASIGGN